MADESTNKVDALEIARNWCDAKGSGWSVAASLGKGGTAPVFEVLSPDGPRALKIYDEKFSVGEKGNIEEKRIEQQLSLTGHDCPFLIQIYEGGRFQDRLFLLMSRARGSELEKKLADVPRNKIRQVVDQVARAAIFLREKGLCHRDIKAANVFVSDDFDHSTLLDISVIREVSDPVGLGTDHDGQLPVVATARYSPPEYLFRLVDPGQELWHALNVYQLGGLLHDLIMRQPLFQAEYEKSTQNRYRFAWIIATMNPMVVAPDVDQDLVLTAQRSLDKNWKRRSTLKLEDFLADAVVQQRSALRVLGLSTAATTNSGDTDFTSRLQRVLEVSRALDAEVVQYLRSKGVTPRHSAEPGPSDVSRVVWFAWTTPASGEPRFPRATELRLTLVLLKRDHGAHFSLSAALQTEVNGSGANDAIEMPELRDEPGVEAALSLQAISGFERLAMSVTQGQNTVQER